MPSRYDQCRHFEADKIAETCRVVERCPKVERHFVDPARERNPLLVWQGIPRAIASPIVDKAPHRSNVVSAIDGACDRRRDLGNLPEGPLVLVIAMAQQMKCSRLNKRQAL